MAGVVAAAGPAEAQGQTVGLFLNDPESYQGYTLFAPNGSQTTYLIDNAGRVVNTWDSDYDPGLSVYLLENGNLLRTGQYAPPGVPRMNVGGAGGRILLYTWDGTLIWDFVHSDDFVRQHHDVEYLPNGNVLLVSWELKTHPQVIAAGWDPSLITDNELWPDYIVEIEPDGLSGGKIVWEWHVWDHLIQDFDPSKANYGAVADHPELIDVNFDPRTGPRLGTADWHHVNSVDYNPALDQILLSSRVFNEIWVIDHSTTTAEAAGHTGGNSGMGGDLLYRWGNPQSYRRGTSSDQKLFAQHDARWIEPGLPGAGNITVFNNGSRRPGGNYSSVDEIVPPEDGTGHYTLVAGTAYGPSDPVWTYVADPPEDLYANAVSGANRLPNGNTMICDGPVGTFFEVKPTLEMVWKYVNPDASSGILTQGDPLDSNPVFRSPRYAPDYPGFDGRDMTPGDPVEFYTSPLPVPDGSGGTTALFAEKLTATGDWIQVTWDVSSCSADEYNLVFGYLADVSSYDLQGAECAIGTTGLHDWSDVPAEDLFFLVVGVDGTGVYESSWGTGASGVERNGTTPSNTCFATTKDVSETCP